MFLTLLHGLGIRKNQATNYSYSDLTANALTAPLGKSHGSYTLDTLSEKAIEITTNLPDVSGYLKQTQVDFIIERSKTQNVDFIIATAQPMFPANLGTPIIDKQYIESLWGKKFITYQNNVTNEWSQWKELNCDLSYLGIFDILSNETKVVSIDPVTLREYFINLNPNCILNIDVVNVAKFTKPIFIDLAPEGSVYSVNWIGAPLTWVNQTQSPPETVTPGLRVRIEINKSPDNLLLASYEIYKA